VYCSPFDLFLCKAILITYEGLLSLLQIFTFYIYWGILTLPYTLPSESKPQIAATTQRFFVYKNTLQGPTSLWDPAVLSQLNYKYMKLYWSKLFTPSPHTWTHLSGVHDSKMLSSHACLATPPHFLYCTMNYKPVVRIFPHAGNRSFFNMNPSPPTECLIRCPLFMINFFLFELKYDMPLPFPRQN
jgi:hypothetical protein